MSVQTTGTTNQEIAIGILSLYGSKDPLVLQTIEAIETNRFLPSYVAECLMKAGHARATMFEQDLYCAGRLMTNPMEIQR